MRCRNIVTDCWRTRNIIPWTPSEFRFIFHYRRIATGVKDPMGWAQTDQYLVDLYPRNGRSWTKTHFSHATYIGSRFRTLRQARHLWQGWKRGINHEDMWGQKSEYGITMGNYVHNCALCYDNRPATQCPTIGPVIYNDLSYECQNPSLWLWANWLHLLLSPVGFSGLYGLVLAALETL